MNWIKENKKKVAGVLAAVIALFVSIAEMTGTKKDDAIADKLAPIGEKLEAFAKDGTNTVNTNKP